MGCNKSSSKQEVYHDKHLHEEKNDLKETNFTFQGTTKSKLNPMCAEEIK